ncbi:hypothetical protein BDV10DRAFT_171977 [Aspergillus recurvatus]
MDLSRLSTGRTADESSSQRNWPEEPDENASVPRLIGARQGDDPIGRLFLVPHSSQSLDAKSRLPGHLSYPSCTLEITRFTAPWCLDVKLRSLTAILGGATKRT